MLPYFFHVFDADWQAAMLLDAPKASADDIADISSSCFKLNSLQLRALLNNYFSGQHSQLFLSTQLKLAVHHDQKNSYS